MNAQEPQETDNDSAKNASNNQSQTKWKSHQSNILGGLVLITFGALLLAQELFPGFDFQKYWPIILIVIGVGLIVSAFERKPEQ